MAEIAIIDIIEGKEVCPNDYEPLLKDKCPSTVTGCDSSNDFILPQVKRGKFKKDSSCRSTKNKFYRIEHIRWSFIMC